ncbi:MAG: hypothetical protein ACFCU4_08740 [Puniceicoccaceae bacterium]
MHYLFEAPILEAARNLKKEVEVGFPRSVHRAERLICSLEEYENNNDEESLWAAYEAGYSLMAEMIQAQRTDATEVIPRLLGGMKILVARLGLAQQDSAKRNLPLVFVEKYTFGFIAVFEGLTLHLSLTEVSALAPS